MFLCNTLKVYYFLLTNYWRKGGNNLSNIFASVVDCPDEDGTHSRWSLTRKNVVTPSLKQFLGCRHFVLAGYTWIRDCNLNEIFKWCTFLSATFHKLWSMKISSISTMTTCARQYLLLRWVLLNDVPSRHICKAQTSGHQRPTEARSATGSGLLRLKLHPLQNHIISIHYGALRNL